MIKLFTRHVDRSLTLTMDFPACGSTATGLLMLLFTRYKTVRGLPAISSVAVFCVTCQDVCALQSRTWAQFCCERWGGQLGVKPI